ncbi:MAG: NAD(P)-dependent glycerol-3-phosphate dehydrogenase [Proteobacteria bacterium]|nr:NAD(P)-dependent glycerol-3-phosphate dehydrogenase [Pseudomonadota bacterium]
MERIGIIGAGAWGTALAATARRAGRDVVLWARDPDLAEGINLRNENRLYLPGVPLDPEIRATAEPAALAEAEVLLMVAPAQHLRAVSARLADHIPEGRPVVVCAKGIEQVSGKLMTEVLAETLPGRPLAVLSGPNLATEIACGLPAATTLAAEDKALAERLAAALGSKTFRPYISPDTVGAQVGGAVKNVIAIACGIVGGRRLGNNARAALITRGLAEVVRLGRAKGARAETLMGLSGLGDLTLTCTSISSRNHSLGRALGEGRELDEIMAKRRSVAEGVFSAQAVVALAETLNVEMPISAAVDAILNRGAGIDETIEALLARPFRAEFP